MTDFTINEMIYIYIMKFFHNDEKYTKTGWWNALSNPRKNSVAYRTVNKAIDMGMLKLCRRDNNGNPMYKINDSRIVEFFESNEKSVLMRTVLNELIEERWSSSPSIKMHNVSKMKPLL